MSESTLCDQRELKTKIKSKIEHLSCNEKNILQPVLLKYKRLFREPNTIPVVK